MNTPRPPRISGLSALADRYRVLLCDVWGVIHNGVALYDGVADALTRYRATGGKVVLLTNAPRPNAPIRQQLARLGLPAAAYDDIVTSGDVAREEITGWAATGRRHIHHVGPDRDLPLFEGLEIERVALADADAVVITGLFDDTTETPADYRATFAEIAARRLPVLSANPDRVIDRGGVMVYCAGALADVHVEAGGTPTLIGKPYPAVYAAARRRARALAGAALTDADVLAVGDALATDVKGGFDAGFDVLYVTGGIHAADYGPAEAPDAARVAAALTAEGLGATAFLPRLIWASAV